MSYATEVLADAPHTYWPLDDLTGPGAPVADLSGNGRTGSTEWLDPTPGLLVSQPDVPGALTLSTGSWVYRRDPKLGNPATFACEGWYRFTGFQGNPTVMCHDDNGSPGALRWRFNVNTSTRRFQLLTRRVGGDLDVSEHAGPQLETGTTYHVVLSYAGGTFTIYVNGAVHGSPITVPSLDTPSGGFLQFGGLSGVPSSSVTGVMDELAYYETALPAERVASHYAAGASVAPPDPPTASAYRAAVRIGSHVWDVNAGDPPAYGPRLPLSFGWAVPEDSLGFPAQPDPDLCSMELVTVGAGDMSGVDVGTTMQVCLYAPADSPRPFATFRGRVADLEATPHDHAPTALAWRVLGVGYTADPSETTVGASAWPQETGDERAARIMAEAGYPGWSADPIGTTWEARNPAPVTARSALEAVADQAVTADAHAYGPSRRVLFHPNTDVDGNLLPGAPFAGAAVLRRTDALDTITAGLVNRRTSWRRTRLLDATWVKIDHPGGPTVYGDPRGSAYPPVSVQVLDPRELADLILDTTPGRRWLTGDALRLEAHAADTDTLDTVARWFYRDPDSEPFPWAGRAVVVENITQTPDNSTRYAGMLRAASVTLEPSPVGGRLVVLFWLRPDIPAASTVTMRWMDEPAGATWADELADDPTGTWYDYYTRPRP